jgi:3-phenylpropionate/trans-cinnamate dioxygenase ferredoxin reductase component
MALAAGASAAGSWGSYVVGLVLSLRAGREVKERMGEGTGARPMVIIGGGKAGGSAAATLREEGFGGPVVLISREPELPFGRPPLSKTYLRSEAGLEDWYVKPAGWYQANDVELRTDSVVAVDPTAHQLALASGRDLEYGKLLVATGGRNRRLVVPGVELPGIHSLRTVADCDAIKHQAVAGRRAVVVGMGFIGCEVAASLTQLGVQVTAVFPGRHPLERVLGEPLGALIGGIHRAKGVRLLAGAQVAAFEGTRRLEGVVLADGNRVGCDLAVVGVGIEPELAAVAGAALAQDNGVLVDEQCRTSAADVYAAGDVANHRHPVLGRIRVEHYNSAARHGAAAARAMLGSEAPFDYLHNFWSDQYEHVLQYVGHASAWDDFAVRGSVAEGRLVGFYLAGGLVRAAVGWDRGGDPEWEPDSEMAACAGLVARRARPNRAALTDEDTDLQSLSA